MLGALSCAISQEGVGCGIPGVFFPVARAALPVRPAFPYLTRASSINGKYGRAWPLPGQLLSQYPMHSSMAAPLKPIIPSSTTSSTASGTKQQVGSLG